MFNRARERIDCHLVSEKCPRGLYEQLADALADENSSFFKLPEKVALQRKFRKNTSEKNGTIFGNLFPRVSPFPFLEAPWK